MFTNPPLGNTMKKTTIGGILEIDRGGMLQFFNRTHIGGYYIILGG